MDNGSSFTRVKRPGQEDDHTSPSSALVKNKWICTSTPLSGLYDVDRDILTFYRTVNEERRFSKQLTTCTGYTQKNGAVSLYAPLKPHHSFVYTLYIPNVKYCLHSLN